MSSKFGPVEYKSKINSEKDAIGLDFLFCMYKNIHVHLNFKVSSLASFFLYVLFSFTFVSEIERDKKKKG